MGIAPLAESSSKLVILIDFECGKKWGEGVPMLGRFDRVLIAKFHN